MVHIHENPSKFGLDGSCETRDDHPLCQLLANTSFSNHGIPSKSPTKIVTPDYDDSQIDAKNGGFSTEKRRNPTDATIPDQRK